MFSGLLLKSIVVIQVDCQLKIVKEYLSWSETPKLAQLQLTPLGVRGKPFVSNCDTSIAIKVLLQSDSNLKLQKYNCTSWIGSGKPQHNTPRIYTVHMNSQRHNARRGIPRIRGSLTCLP